MFTGCNLILIKKEKMKTTLRRIKENKNKPCQRGWKLLISNVDNDLDRELPIKEILESNGIRDAVWALECVDDQRSVRLFAADIAESVLYIFEEWHSNDNRPRLAIEAARDFANGLIGKDELIDACYAAADAAYDTACNAAYAAAYAADYAADEAIRAADAAYVTNDTVRQEKWQEIEKMLLKYL